MLTLSSLLPSSLCLVVYPLLFPTAGICRLISMALIEPSLTDCNRCILDHFFLDDNKLWIGEYTNTSNTVVPAANTVLHFS